MAAALLLRRVAALRPPSAWLAALLIALLHGAYTWWRGILLSGDSRTYADWSGRLADSGFDFAAIFTQGEIGGFPALLYALFVTLLALLRLLFGEGWMLALVLLQLATHIAVGVMIVRLAGRATDSRAPGSGAAGWAALLLYLACFDLLVWVPFVLSDATFVFLAFLIFYLAAARILGDSRNWLPVALPAAAGIFYRPTGIVLVPDLIWAFYLSRRRTPPQLRRVHLLLLAGAFAAGILLFAWLMQDPSRWPFDLLSGPFQVIAERYAAGEVMSGRFETHHAPPRTLLDFLLMIGDRFLHFFAIGAADYSLAHWLVSAAFLLPCYLLSGWLLVALARGRTDFAAPARKLFYAAAGAILAYAVFHALILIDYDWRYRTPVLPHLILLAAGGLADLLRRVPAR